MRRLQVIFNTIMEWLRPRRPSRPEDIPEKLDAETLEKVMREARFLYSQAVNVKPLTPGEIPMPRRADKN
jgi:hypothetical protein